MKITPLKKLINYTVLAIVSWNLIFLMVLLSFKAEAATQPCAKGKCQDESVQSQAIKRLDSYRGTKSWMMGKLFRVQQQMFNKGRLSLFELYSTEPVIMHQRRYFNEPPISLNPNAGDWVHEMQFDTYFYDGPCNNPRLSSNEGIYVIAVPFNNNETLLTPWWPKFGGYDRIDKCYE